MEVDVITLQDIFYFKQEGFDKDGKVKGRFVATGFVPEVLRGAAAARHPRQHEHLPRGVAGAWQAAVRAGGWRSSGPTGSGGRSPWARRS